jgi:hypothetical protein
MMAWGIMTPEGVRPSIAKERLMFRYNVYGWYSEQIPNYLLLEHFDGLQTVYYSSHPDLDVMLLMIDIDALKSRGLGSPAGAKAFAEHLRRRFPNLYFEPSTTATASTAICSSTSTA